MSFFTLKTTSAAPRHWLAALLILAGAALLSPARAATLTDLQANTLPGDGVEVRLDFKGNAPQVKGYSIERPARIALDLLDTNSAVDVRRHNLGTGNARSVTVVEAKDRTRLIFNLEQLTGYDTRVEGQQLVITLGGGQSTPRMDPASPSPMVASEAAISDIDFRRGGDGEGRVMINLSKASMPVDVSEEGGKIIARFVGAEIADDLVRRLDVTDFATPVKYVDTRRTDGGTVVTIEPEGTWEYLAYQADNLFSINIKPLTPAEKERQRREAFKYDGEKLSLNFQDIEVRSVLQLIADFTDLNLVASDTVTGRITLRLQSVPWDQALELILKTKGLDKRQVGNVLLVAPADEIAAREKQELEAQKQLASLAPLRTEYISINYARAEQLQTLITAQGGSEGSSLISERGSVTVDQRTNTLIVQDTSARLEDIRDLIRRLDVPVQQVLIEARVVIASTNVADEFGVRWGGLGWQSSLWDEGKSWGVSGRHTSLRNLHYANLEADRSKNPIETEMEEFDEEQNNDLIVDMGVESTDATRFSIGFTSLDSGLIELELSALESEGHGELVATPKVLTADQQPAVIASGQQVPFNVATASGATAVEFIEAELRLEVTPQVTPEGDVIMQLKVNNDSLGTNLDNPAINTNRVETTVLVNDGETVVLGGIFQQETVNSVIKTPFLGDIPWLGALFRKKVNRDNKQELLIFITPRLVKDAMVNR
ncbi:type IV pilus secretin PilQ [Alloalcanivorax gelatiniphagus]|uniref:Type IV pilus secretin PilQ n=1 Tax=Alloalcanivorax gelatiniphagus TaxID=1194167 RepID=A0ABY2XKQ1_9GAMM|nr:type IV pilus secretin PilQ [Alloalcanivorax gelatiniphagus]|tara:strand:- start:4202 stop:6346 length:2145 start_codon:yes stop_codon:yes gene_type:complete